MIFGDSFSVAWLGFVTNLVACARRMVTRTAAGVGQAVANSGSTRKSTSRSGGCEVRGVGYLVLGTAVVYLGIGFEIVTSALIFNLQFFPVKDAGDLLCMAEDGRGMVPAQQLLINSLPAVVVMSLVVVVVTDSAAAGEKFEGLHWRGPPGGGGP